MFQKYLQGDNYKALEFSVGSTPLFDAIFKTGQFPQGQFDALKTVTIVFTSKTDKAQAKRLVLSSKSTLEGECCVLTVVKYVLSYKDLGVK